MKINKYQQDNFFSPTLYVVPTPIGNLDDITIRALSILKQVDLIAAENTRHTSFLLKYFNISINSRLFALHAHNERQKSNILLEKLKSGQNIALVSNAGTPLINDPGYHLVRRCWKAGIRIVPLPGACAAIAALSASGLPSNRFCYEGFLPTQRAARLSFLEKWMQEPRTIIFYESTHRLLESLEDILTIWGPLRYVVLARELTKIWESIYGAPIMELVAWVKEKKTRCRGEMVLVVEGYRSSEDVLLVKPLKTLSLLRTELPLKKAATLTAKIHNVKKNALYKQAIKVTVKSNN